MIADNIEISIVEISKGHVKLGIKAPKQITIHRKEVYEAIMRENIEAAKVNAEDVSKIKDFFSKRDDK